MARIVRGQTLMLKQKEFVEAARAAGVKPIGLIVRYICPTCSGAWPVYVAHHHVVILQGFLHRPQREQTLTSLGRLISEGQREFSYPWMLLVPAVTMVITLFSLNFIGDGLRDAFDPKAARLTLGPCLAGHLLHDRPLRQVEARARQKPAVLVEDVDHFSSSGHVSFNRAASSACPSFGLSPGAVTGSRLPCRGWFLDIGGSDCRLLRKARDEHIHTSRRSSALRTACRNRPAGPASRSCRSPAPRLHAARPPTRSSSRRASTEAITNVAADAAFARRRCAIAGSKR